jgi:hypothetical protein
MTDDNKNVNTILNTAINLNNNIYSRNVIWLYSAKYGNMWWCYNNETSLKLDLIYADFMKLTDSNNVAIEKNYKTVDPESLRSSPDLLYNPSFDPVIYDDINDSDTKVVVKDNNNVVVDYMIQVDNNKFVIDFNHWQQINFVHNYRKRKIMRLIIPDNIGNVKEYLIQQKYIKGISGEVWL